jgi:hypothetical protein
MNGGWLLIKEKPFQMVDSLVIFSIKINRDHFGVL